METFRLQRSEQWREALTFSLICAWTNGWANNRDAGDLRRYCAHYDVTVMADNLIAHRKKSHCSAVPHCPVFDGFLCSQIFHWLNRTLHTLRSEEGGQVGRIRRHDEQGENPPYTAYDTTRYGPWYKNRLIWQGLLKNEIKHITATTKVDNNWTFEHIKATYVLLT